MNERDEYKEEMLVAKEREERRRQLQVQQGYSEPKATAPMKGLTVGRMVHFVNHASGVHMAAIVVYVCDASCGLVNLFVPPDMHDETVPLTPTLVLFDPGATAGPQRGTWHWIEQA